MRIGADLGAYRLTPYPSTPDTQPHTNHPTSPSYEIASPQIQNAGGEQFQQTPISEQRIGPVAYNQAITERLEHDLQSKLAKRLGIVECETCSNRRYQDDSNDSGVSFQTPQHIPPQHSFAMVYAHEQEHVHRERTKADADDQLEVISQSVSIHMDVCPECGRIYTAGGETITRTRRTPHTEADSYADTPAQAIGQHLDRLV